jgi:DNA-binding beta-propeller fold protein YncE
MRRLVVTAITIGCFFLQLGPGTLAQAVVDPDFTGPANARVLWQARYDGPMSDVDRVAEMALHPDGTIVYVTGESYGSLYSLDYLTLAYEADTGRQLWEARYDTSWRRDDLATHVRVSPDGAIVYVTGTSIGSGADGGMGTGLGDADWDFVTLAYDAQTGVQLWDQRYHGHQRGDGWTNSIAMAPDNSKVLINGRSSCRDNPETVEVEPGNATIAYDALTGDELWVACFDACLSYEDFGTQLAVSADNSTAILAGTRRNYNTGFDFATIGYNLQTGEQLWVRHYDNGLHDPDAFPQEPTFPGADPTLDSPRAIAIDPTGVAVYVTGVSRGRYGFLDYVTVAYDVSNGAQKGVARFDGDLSGRDRANAITVSPDGLQVFVTGESHTMDVGREVVTIAYDERLREQLWVARHNTTDAESGTPDNRDDMARLIDVSDDGRTVMVGGDSWGTNSLDWMFVAYDADTGQQKWSGLYNGVLSHADFYRGLAVNGDASRVFLTGHSCSCGTGGLDFLTMGIAVDGVAEMSTSSPWFSPRKNTRHVREPDRRR